MEGHKLIKAERIGFGGLVLKVVFLQPTGTESGEVIIDYLVFCTFVFSLHIRQ
jgi:hypothetical protein